MYVMVVDQRNRGIGNDTMVSLQLCDEAEPVDTGCKCTVATHQIYYPGRIPDGRRPNRNVDGTDLVGFAR